MAIPGNLPSQLRVLDSSQQLYAPLFLASDCGSLHTLSLIFSQKTPPSFYDAIFSHFLFSSETLPRSSTGPLKLNSALLPPSSFFPFFLSPLSRICLHNDLCRSHLFSSTLLLQPLFLPHSFCSHLFCLRDPPSESSSTCQSPTATTKSEVDFLWSLTM